MLDHLRTLVLLPYDLACAVVDEITVRLMHRYVYPALTAWDELEYEQAKAIIERADKEPHHQ